MTALRIITASPNMADSTIHALCCTLSALYHSKAVPNFSLSGILDEKHGSYLHLYKYISTSDLKHCA